MSTSKVSAEKERHDRHMAAVRPHLDACIRCAFGLVAGMLTGDERGFCVEGLGIMRAAHAEMTVPHECPGFMKCHARGPDDPPETPEEVIARHFNRTKAHLDNCVPCCLAMEHGSGFCETGNTFMAEAHKEMTSPHECPGYLTCNAAAPWAPKQDGGAA